MNIFIVEAHACDKIDEKPGVCAQKFFLLKIIVFQILNDKLTILNMIDTKQMLESKTKRSEQPLEIERLVRNTSEVAQPRIRSFDHASSVMKQRFLTFFPSLFKTNESYFDVLDLFSKKFDEDKIYRNQKINFEPVYFTEFIFYATIIFSAMFLFKSVNVFWPKKNQNSIHVIEIRQSKSKINIGNCAKFIFVFFICFVLFAIFYCFFYKIFTFFQNPDCPNYFLRNGKVYLIQKIDQKLWKIIE